MTTFIIYLIVSLVILALIFLLIREVVLWYYKINENIKYQQKQTELLMFIFLQLKGRLPEDDGKDYTFGDQILLINTDTGAEKTFDYLDYKRQQISNDLGPWRTKNH